MAKIEQGYMGGFIGRLGPAVGYSWRGRWCMRSLPAHVHNPQTPAQQAHRMEFREMVRLAGRFRPAIIPGMRDDALRAGITECNLFVHRNHRSLTADGLDYSALQVSRGPVAPVGFSGWTVDERGILEVPFDKNPLARRVGGDDEIHIFIYSPALQQGLKLQTTRRRAGRAAIQLPDGWQNLELHLYGFVADRQGHVSNSSYIPHLPNPTNTSTPSNTPNLTNPTNTTNTPNLPNPSAPTNPTAAPPPPPTAKLSP